MNPEWHGWDIGERRLALDGKLWVERTHARSFLAYADDGVTLARTKDTAVVSDWLTHGMEAVTMGGMKAMLNLDNVQLILVRYGVAAAGTAQGRRTALYNALQQQGMEMVCDADAIGAFQSIAIEGKLYSTSYEARDWLNGGYFLSDKGRSFVPLGVIIDHQSRYIMLAL